MHSFRLRLFLTLLFVVVMAVTITALFAQQDTTQQFDQYLGVSEALDQQAMAMVFEQVGQQNPTNVEPLAEAMSQAYNVQITIVGDSGDVMVASGGGPAGTIAIPPPTLLIDPHPVFIGQEPANIIFGPAGVGHVISGQVTASTITINSNPIPTAPEAAFLGSVNRSFWLAGLAAIATTGLVSLALSQRILQPIEALTRAAHSMENGNLSQRVDIKRKDEIGSLAHAFNAMADGLSRLEQLRRNMVNDVAHELRTPLTNIRGYLEAAEDGLLPNDASLLFSLHEEVMLLNRLVEDLQELSLAEARQLSLEQLKLDLGPLVEGVVAAAEVQGQTIEMKVDVPAGLPPVWADPERVGQILRNLLHNALTHTPAGQQISVQAREQGPEIIIAVHNSGSTIAPEHLPYIFNRFYRADPSRARQTGGAGLGLAIVKELVEMHSGRVWVESQNGVTFFFSLPKNPSSL